MKRSNTMAEYHGEFYKMFYPEMKWPWASLPGPGMPRFILEPEGIPEEVLKKLMEIGPKKQGNLVAGPVVRFGQTTRTLFGAVSIASMMQDRTAEGKGWMPWSPQMVLALVPAQANLAIVNLSNDPMFVFIERSRELAAAPEISKIFWDAGYCPSIEAIYPFLGVTMCEAPRGAQPEGGKAASIGAKEAEEELGMKAVKSIFVDYVYQDAGQIAFALPHTLAFMEADSKKIEQIDLRESVSFKGLRFVRPENLLTEFNTACGVTRSQISSFLSFVTKLSVKDTINAVTSEGETTTLSTEERNCLKALGKKIFQGALDALN